MQALTIEELTEQADCIAVARVVYLEPVLNGDGTISTWSRLLVEQPLRGEATAGDEILVETLGGQIGGIGMHVEGEPAFTVVGERIVLFGRASGHARFRPIGMAQGVFRTRTVGSAETVVPSRRGLLLVRRDKSGALSQATVDPPRPEALHNFVSRVRALIQARDTQTDE